jgi:hypothetical protein
MTKLDTEAIAKNRRTMENSTIDSPLCAQIEDSDSDYGVRLYGGDNMPADQVGLMPPNEKNRSKG